MPSGAESQPPNHSLKYNNNIASNVYGYKLQSTSPIAPFYYSWKELPLSNVTHSNTF